MLETPEIKCSVCDSVMTRIFTPNIGGFIIKGGTPTMHYREKRARVKKSEELAQKQKQVHEGPKIQPNIAGLETDTWRDAQKLAKEAGMNSESYQPWVEKEKSKIII
jgi:hypothetical protein